MVTDVGTTPRLIQPDGHIHPMHEAPHPGSGLRSQVPSNLTHVRSVGLPESIFESPLLAASLTVDEQSQQRQKNEQPQHVEHEGHADVDQRPGHVHWVARHRVGAASDEPVRMFKVYLTRSPRSPGSQHRPSDDERPTEQTHPSG